MRLTIGTVSHLSCAIEQDLKSRAHNLSEHILIGLSDCVASALTCKSSNTAEWQSVLPRKSADKSKERYISRLLANQEFDAFEVMKSYIPQIVTLLSRNGQTVVLMMDQSNIKDDLQCLMISMRFGKRAIPILWKVVKTKGNIGFEDQKELLDKVKEAIPSWVEVLLSADRFYGTKSFVEWCQKNDWHYRVRLKGNLIFQHEGGEITAAEVGKMDGSRVIGARFNDSDISTNIGFLHEEGHPEPWIIAMDCVPSKHRVLDYGMRWGIECMFSDFKSRGFAITGTHLKHEKRIENLILILTIAIYWAVSVGTTPKKQENYSKKTSQINYFLLQARTPIYN
ncbi:hypothetical protein FACS1894122_13870 [Alphaproteobacteria bacterium]|nr:hypothetical protein FACS1894122_13870 [Alphaproteobacteria bacterium]